VVASDYQVFESAETEAEPSLVLPSRPSGIEISKEVREKASSGSEYAFWGMVLIFLFLAGLSESRGGRDSTKSILVCLAIGLCLPWVIYFAVRRMRVSAARFDLTTARHRQMVAEAKAKYSAEVQAIQSRRTNYSESTEAVSRQMNIIRSDSLQLFANLEPLRMNAAGWLVVAETEFENRAFGPFWDAIENTANWLGSLNDHVTRLGANAETYYSSLAVRHHNFPLFPIDLAHVPGSYEEVERLRLLVRKGQTDFQFANIWEHRQTREVLIAGFRTLGSALQNLATSFESSIAGLRGSMASDNSRIVEEQIKAREAMERLRGTR
jgi:hypothetical protein